MEDLVHLGAIFAETVFFYELSEGLTKLLIAETVFVYERSEGLADSLMII
jgi:hypothetical protein